MNIKFNPDNSISILDNDGKVLYKGDQKSFQDTHLSNLGFSNQQIHDINLVLNQRKYNFYTA